jgi:hypothetical protein
LIDGFGVSLNLSQGGVTRDGSDLVGATACLSKAPTCGLAQSVEGAFLRKPSGFAPYAKLSAEIVTGIRLSGSGDEKR